jgi:hypothetical protein
LPQAELLTSEITESVAMEEVGARALEFRDSLYRPTAAGALH